MKKFNRIPMFLAVFAFMAFLISCSGGANSPTGVSKSFLLKVEKGDTEAAAKMFEGMENATEEEMQKSKALLDESSKEIAAQGGIKKVDVLNETISEDGQTASVDLKVTFGNGEEDESTTKLIKTEDGWKLTLGK